jgi:ribosomal protein L5
MARLREKYKSEIAPALAKEFEIKNPMAIPKIEKIVVNMGLGEASANGPKRRSGPLAFKGAWYAFQTIKRWQR